jgi:diguanylate cyclase (GGDEF)-like protein/PAS domain S-box-containing protein
MGGWSVEFLRGVLDAAPEGIVVCECDGEDSPIAYANDAFLRLTGYDLHDLIGQDLRRLQGTDREQDGRKQLREAIIRGVSCRALLRNYRKDGSQFWNEVVIQPMRDDTGRVTHIVGFHRDVSERSARTDARTDAARPASGLPSWLRDDRLSGLYSRAYFEEMLHHDWQVGVRDALPLTLMMFDINELGSYNDTFGRPAGDACIRRVAAIIGGSFKRGADAVARWEGGRIVALVRNGDVNAVPEFADSVARKVLGQHIHHPHAQRYKFVTVSIGAVTLRPSADRSTEQLILAAERALQRAKLDSDRCIAIAEEQEISGAA